MKKVLTGLGLATLLVSVPQFVSADETPSQEVVEEQNTTETEEPAVIEKQVEQEVPAEEQTQQN